MSRWVSQRSSAAGLALGWAADQAFGDPRRGHPVAGFGAAAAALERRTYAADRAHGVAHVAILVGGAAVAGAILERAVASHAGRHAALVATATWAVLGGRSLVREAGIIHGQLDRGDLTAARVQVRNLVGRDTASLDADGVARACIESLAENTSDAVVAPLLWGAVAGVPGLLAYRASNTLDAMVGHRSSRYERFGWAAARLDDLVNWAPARVTAALALAAAPAAHVVAEGGAGPPRQGSATAGIAAVRRDAHRHPSPNAGVVEAAFAGVLGVSLGGSNVYDGRAEDRGVLGDGPPAGVNDIPRATHLAQLVSAGALAIAVGVRVSLSLRGGRGARPPGAGPGPESTPQRPPRSPRR